MSKQNPIDLTQESQYPEEIPDDSDVEEIPRPVKKSKKGIYPVIGKKIGGDRKVAFSQAERMKFPPTSPRASLDCDEEIVYSCPFCEDVDWDKAMIVDQCNMCRNLKVLIQDLCTCDERWAEAADSRESGGETPSYE